METKEEEAEDDNKKKKKSAGKRISTWFWQRTTGVGVCMVLLASLTFTVNSLMAKLLLANEHTNSLFLSFSRAALMLFYIAPMCAFNKVNVVKEPLLRSHWVTLLVRCIAGNCGVLLYFLALAYTPLSEAGVIFNAFSPTFSSILSCAILKERFRYLDILLFILSLSGVVLMLRPPFIFPPELAQGHHDIPFQDRLIGNGCAFAASFCQATAILCMKMLAKLDSSLVVWWFALAGGVGFMPFAIGFGMFQLPTCYEHRAGAIVCGLASTMGQILMTFASRHVPAPIVSLCRSAELAFLFIAQTLLLQTVPHFLSLIGSAVIIFSMSILIVRAFIIDKMKQSAQRSDATLFAPNGRYYSLFVCFTK